MFADLSLLQIGSIFATYVFAATAKGITGLGFSTTCLPILALTVGLKDALPLGIIPSSCSNLVVMHQAGHFGETVKLLALFPGLALGLWTLSRISGDQAGAVLGLMLLLWCAFSVAKPNLHLAPGLERLLAPLSGGLTGFINGITGSQVMPAVPFLMMLHLERNQFVHAINCSFTLSSFVMAMGLGQLGLFSFSALLVSTLGTGFVFIGLRAGAAVRHRLSERLFRNAVLTMLSLMGLGLIVPALS